MCNDGAVYVYHNNAAKLTTTATGIDVTGSVTADGLTVSTATGSATPVPTEIIIKSETDASDWSDTLPWGRVNFYSQDGSTNGPKTEAAIDVTKGGAGGGVSQLSMSTCNSTTGSLEKRISIEPDGDISFYEDTGTTPKFFWDSSAESLTLSGSGAGSLTLDRGASGNQIKFANAGTTLGYIGYAATIGFAISGADGGADVTVGTRATWESVRLRQTR